MHGTTKSAVKKRRRMRGLAAVVALLLPLLVLPARGAPRQPQPAMRVTLESLGASASSQWLLDAGASMLSVHFVDSTHGLITFGLRGLVERIPGDPVEDDDRNVAAVLVELGSGKVLARTQWHLHDHGQYLWALGEGRFLVRNRTTLTAIAPLKNLASGKAFREMPFVHVSGHIDALVISPEGDLVTVETSAERTPTQAGERPQRGPEVFAFLWAQGDGSAEAPVKAIAAGHVGGAGPALPLPLNSRGYLRAEMKARNHWQIRFDGLDGKSKALEYVDSSCVPRLQFVSPGQYVALSCRGADERIMISAFDFAPHEMWEEPLTGTTGLPTFAYAPASGRFAMSRMSSSVAAVANGLAAQGLLGDTTTAQEVRVYQTQSGDMLLRLPSTPVLRTAQNFDLSADGTSLMVVRGGAVEVYKLPALSGRDQKELAEARGFEPAAMGSADVKFRGGAVQKSAAAGAGSGAAGVGSAGIVGAGAPATTGGGGSEAVSGVGVAAKPVEVVGLVERRRVIENGDDESVRTGAPTLLQPGERTEDGKPSGSREEGKPR